MEFPTKKPIRPKWLYFPVDLPHGNFGKAHEMVHLPKTTLLSTIPAEIQLDIISLLGYHDVRNLKATCRYYNYFIDSDILQQSRKKQISAFEEMERKRACRANLPCYICLTLKPVAHFWSKAGGYYSTTRQVQPLQNRTERYCIPCGFKNNKFERGLRLTVDGITAMLCPGCGTLVRNISTSRFYHHNATNSCLQCKKQWSILWGWGWVLRFFQFVLGVIIFALSCTGQSVPATSVISKDSYRFIFTALVCILTVGAALASVAIRTMANDWFSGSAKRAENYRFVFITELAGLFVWIVVLSSLVNEGINNGFRDPFDKFAKSVLGLEVILLLTFMATTGLATDKGLKCCARAKKDKGLGN